MKDITKYEVGINGQAADIIFTLVRLEDNKWELEVIDTYKLENNDTFGSKDKYPQKQGIFLLSNEEAACMLALFIIGDFENDSHFNSLIWEKVKRLESIPTNLRLIP